MLASGAAVAWAVLIVAGFARRPPVPARVARLAGPAAPAGSAWPAVFADPRARRLVPAAVAALVTVLVWASAAPVVAVAVWAAPVVRARRRRGSAADAVRRSLPEVVDLLRLAVGAGLTVPLAVEAVGRRHDGPVGAELRRATGDAAGGASWGDALDDAARRLGPDARRLLDALAASERYGAPLDEALAVLATDLRADRRRRAEEAARRVPVQLLFPLVVCVLPAFALLTVAPLLAGAFGSLRL